MPTEKRNYVAVLPNGTESNHEIHWDTNNTRWNDGKVKGIADDAVRNAGLTTPRNQEPTTIKVKVHRLTIDKGTLKREHPSTFDVTPPLARMTDDDYTRELAEALDGLPIEFAEFVSAKAYDDGHSAGYEEVVSLARGMAYNLKKAVETYNKRLKVK